MEYPDADSLKTAVRAIGGHAPDDASWGKLIDGLLGDYVEPNLIQPTFITQYPRDISPLAKGLPDDPHHVERFEFFIAGMEMGNAFTELNDPLEQQKRFEELQEMYKQGDEELNPIDEDYLRAMRYGMPPNGGFGTGVDRLVMLFTDQSTIREVLLFPHLRERGIAGCRVASDPHPTTRNLQPSLACNLQLATGIMVKNGRNSTTNWLRHRPLQLNILLAFAALLITTVLVIVTYAYRQNSATVLQISDDLISKLATPSPKRRSTTWRPAVLMAQSSARIPGIDERCPG
jgi:hypothetical protein